MKRILLFIMIFFMSMGNVFATSIEDSLNEISAKIKQIKEQDIDIPAKIQEKYPVGSIYMSTSSVDPGTIFGGTWESFGTGRTLVGVASDGEVGTTGGSASVTLTTDNLYAHTHTYTAKGSVSSTFTGTSSSTSTNSASHTHTYYMQASGNEASGYGLHTSGGFYSRILVSSQSSSYDTKTSSATTHYHTVTPKGTVKSTFSGTKKSASSVGSGTAVSVLNPYITVYMWKRIA